MTPCKSFQVIGPADAKGFKGIAKLIVQYLHPKEASVVATRIKPFFMIVTPP